MGKTIKVIIASVVVAAITWTGIAYTGSDALRNVRDNVETLQRERTTILDQVTKLKDRLVEMKTEKDNNTTKTEQEKKRDAVDLKKVQAEINRLEAEVNKANLDAEQTKQFVNTIMQARTSVNDLISDVDTLIESTKTPAAAAQTNNITPAAVKNPTLVSAEIPYNIEAMEINKAYTLDFDDITTTAVTINNKTYVHADFINNTDTPIEVTINNITKTSMIGNIIRISKFNVSDDTQIYSQERNAGQNETITVSKGERLQVYVNVTQAPTITRNN